MKISNFRLCENLMAGVGLGILNEHVQHLFAICQHISLNSGFRENDRLNARNPLSIQMEYRFSNFILHAEIRTDNLMLKCYSCKNSTLFNMSQARRKCDLCHMRTTKVQISLRVRAV